MRLVAGCILALAAAPALCAETWLTLTGDAGDAARDTVQVQPESVVSFANLRTIRVRVSRSHERGGYDGQPYRSYISIVHIDCEDRSARFRQLQLFRSPFWSGPSRTTTYRDEDMPPMAFAEMEPNPNERIVQAACTIDRVQTR